MIRLHDVHKSYRVKETEVPALNGIDLTIDAGEIFGIIGHSGAGKSTLIRLINLLERPTQGQVMVGGVDLLSLTPEQLREFRQGVGMIFQHFNLLGSMTVSDNISYAMKIVGKMDAKAMDARVDELLELVGLTKHKHKYPKQLSGGEKQRVGIARALANHPTVLLCDEATSALDPQTTRSILQLLRRINEELRLTIVLITHEMDVIRTICDRVAVIDGGRIVEQGPVTDVFLHPQHETTRRFVMEAEGFTSDAEPVEPMASMAIGSSPKLRMTFLPDTVHQPLLTQAARTHGIDISVLSGRFGFIKSSACGQVTVTVHGSSESVERALHDLRSKGVHVEECLQ